MIAASQSGSDVAAPPARSAPAGVDVQTIRSELTAILSLLRHGS
jgi:hypothetical protein